MTKQRPRRYVVREARQLAAVRSPIRHQILRLLTVMRQGSVREVAERMGRSPESLYYHVKALQKVGLLRHREDRQDRGRPEAVYELPARTLHTDPDQTSAAYLEAMQRSASALLRLAERQIGAALEEQRRTRSRRHPAFRIEQIQGRLKPAALRRMRELLDEVGSLLLDEDDPDGTLVSLTLASAPILRETED